jgi:hypothetical protein
MPAVALLAYNLLQPRLQRACMHGGFLQYAVQAKKFESLGLSREQAEQLSQYLTEQIVLDRLRLSERFAAKVDLEKVCRHLPACECLCRYSAGWIT